MSQFFFFFLSLCKSSAPWGEQEGKSFVVPERNGSEGLCGRALQPAGALLFQLLPGPLVEVSPTFLSASVFVLLSLDEILQLT